MGRRYINAQALRNKTYRGEVQPDWKTVWIFTSLGTSLGFLIGLTIGVLY